MTLMNQSQSWSNMIFNVRNILKWILYDWSSLAGSCCSIVLMELHQNELKNMTIRQKIKYVLFDNDFFWFFLLTSYVTIVAPIYKNGYEHFHKYFHEFLKSGCYLHSRSNFGLKRKISIQTMQSLYLSTHQKSVLSQCSMH